MPFPAQILALPDFQGRFSAKRLDADGCTVYFASYPADTRIEEHAHDTENAGVIVRGKLHLTTAAGERIFGPGDWYTLAPGEPHAAFFPVETEEIEFWFEAK
ncbi:MAG: cupin domain-containing protein [Pseudomonadota bacterium]